MIITPYEPLDRSAIAGGVMCLIFTTDGQVDFVRRHGRTRRGCTRRRTCRREWRVRRRAGPGRSRSCPAVLNSSPDMPHRTHCAPLPGRQTAPKAMSLISPAVSPSCKDSRHQRAPANAAPLEETRRHSAHIPLGKARNPDLRSAAILARYTTPSTALALQILRTCCGRCGYGRGFTASHLQRS